MVHPAPHGKPKNQKHQPGDIAELHRNTAKQVPYETNRVPASPMLELAIHQGFRDETAGNPARRISKFPEKKPAQWVTADALPQLADTIYQEKVIHVRAALRLWWPTFLLRLECQSCSQLSSNIDYSLDCFPFRFSTCTISVSTVSFNRSSSSTVRSSNCSRLYSIVSIIFL